MRESEFSVEEGTRTAWISEIQILKDVLRGKEGAIYFEYSIPRMGRRIDVVLLLGPVIFVLEFKVGEAHFTHEALDQVLDYALDLKNFHETSGPHYVAPVLIATESKSHDLNPLLTAHNDRLFQPLRCGAADLGLVLQRVMSSVTGPSIDVAEWEGGRYHPTPTIIEAAMALYAGHSVTEISRSDAKAINLSLTSDAISEVIEKSRAGRKKSIVFVTGVPGAGKTLVGLNIATKYIDKNSELYSVFLSGNGPLVAILHEALARDKVTHQRERQQRCSKRAALSEVKAFIQNVHHFRDECIRDERRPPVEHVALFDEAQRAWTQNKTADFMKRRKGMPSFAHSEPEYLISCLDRHDDWAVIICLVGGGQEIHTGEAGISEWVDALTRSFQGWNIFVSSRLTEEEYGAGEVLEALRSRKDVSFKDELHLSVSMRSFRAENVSLLVKQILDLDPENARSTLTRIVANYPIVLTRGVETAKRWLKEKARGSERYGIVVSSNAERLRAHGMFVRSPMDPVHWFLDGKDDIRSSYYLEDVATEFSIQGLELDWTCVTWDADFRYRPAGWSHHSFKGNKWLNIVSADRKVYQKNAYRVLLTRARQGMVIVVPEGDSTDPTRDPRFYDPTFEYLKDIGIPLV